MAASDHMELRLATMVGPGNSTPGVPFESIGYTSLDSDFFMSTTVATATNIFPDRYLSTAADHSEDWIEHVLLFVYNTSTTETLIGPYIRIDSQVADGVDVSFHVADNSPNGSFPHSFPSPGDSATTQMDYLASDSFFFVPSSFSYLGGFYDSAAPSGDRPGVSDSPYPAVLPPLYCHGVWLHRQCTGVAQRNDGMTLVMGTWGL